MKKNFDLTKVPLFKSMSQEEIQSVLGCLGAHITQYQKDDFIIHVGDKPENIYIVLDGQVNVIREDLAGHRFVIANISANQVFGESFAIAEMPEYPLSVQAAVDANVLYFKANKITSICENRCGFHKKLVDHMMMLLAKKNVRMNNRMHCLTKKTTKQKLLFYLVEELHLVQKGEIVLPFNREELADYLGVNRSALSRELSALKKKGVFTFKKNTFTLLDEDLLSQILDYAE